MCSSFNKSLELLEIIEREEGIDVKRVYKRNPDFIEVLELLIKLDLVLLANGKYMITEKSTIGIKFLC